MAFFRGKCAEVLSLLKSWFSSATVTQIRVGVDLAREYAPSIELQQAFLEFEAAASAVSDRARAKLREAGTPVAVKLAQRVTSEVRAEHASAQVLA